ncbi:MAG: endonuclease, partial [Bacilli bacterium]|nr:endonuclease [Bacilli bacterium]
MKKSLVCAVLTFFALGYCHGYVGDNRVLKAQSNNTGGDKLNLADTSADDVISYYNGVDGLKGDSLKKELNSIISSDIYTISDSKVWDWMKITDRDWSIGSAVDPDSYTFSSDNNYFFYNLYASYNGDASRAVNRGMNSSGNTLVDREHCWPKSLGFKLSSTSSFVKPAGTDLHHLMASDHNNNNKHSNYAYGEVDTSKSYDSVDDKDSQGNSEPTGLLGYSKLWNN